MSILEIKSLSKRFAQVAALNNVTFSVRDGSVTGLLGPNGAGKTTLLRIINGIISSDTGQVSVLGQPTSLEAARHIGYMPEERGLYDKMTVADQIIYFGRLKGGEESRLREVMNEYLEMFNLVGEEKRKIKELSKGNQQKVQIIATLVHEPELVILDEPFSGFDPINGAILTDLIGRLRSRGTTVMLSSHNMHALEEMCDDIALIDHGNLLLNGSISDIKKQNRDNKIEITLATPLSEADSALKPMVSAISHAPTPSGRTGITYRMEKLPDVSNNDLASVVMANHELIHFEEILPSLNDIFLKYTTRRDL